VTPAAGAQCSRDDGVPGARGGQPSIPETRAAVGDELKAPDDDDVLRLDVARMLRVTVTTTWMIRPKANGDIFKKDCTPLI